MEKAENIIVVSTGVERIKDFAQLVKLKLTMMVVFTSMIGYFIATGGTVQWVTLSLLLSGGFLITSAANALNEVLEKDYDRLMSRTSTRPLPAGRMPMSEGVIFAGLSCIIGIFMLALINPLTALLGASSFVLYAFIYTPLKRYSPISVLIGAIPGALPAAIGFVAHDGVLSSMALILFAIQFIWQMPHFWAIGWLAYEDYEKAGYKMLPSMDKGKSNAIGKQAFIYTLFLIPVSVIPFLFGFLNGWFTALVLFTCFYYVWKAWNFYIKNDRQSAKSLLFASLYYLPTAFTVLLIGSL